MLTDANGERESDTVRGGTIKTHVPQRLDYLHRKPVWRLWLRTAHEAVDTRGKFRPEATLSTSPPQALAGVPQDQSHVRPENKADSRRLKSHQVAFLTMVV